ncbi:hypothetical protein FPOAC2_03813 [Fusarium poae]
MGLSDIVISMLGVPLLPPAPPTDAKKGTKQQSGPASRFLGNKLPQQTDADKKPTLEEKDSEK